MLIECTSRNLLFLLFKRKAGCVAITTTNIRLSSGLCVCIVVFISQCPRNPSPYTACLHSILKAVPRVQAHSYDIRSMCSVFVFLLVSLLLTALFDCRDATNELAVCHAGNSGILPHCRDRRSHLKGEVEPSVSKGKVCLAAADSRNLQGSACPHENKVAATITLAAKSHTEVFVNGHYTGSATSWSSVKTIATPLGKGDVVALITYGRARWPGLIVDITAGNTHHITGSPGWKAIEGNRRHLANPQGWMTRSYSSCRWPSAIRRMRPTRVYSRKAHAFTSQYSAEYVWARGASWHSTILFRYVIGGESCVSTARRSNAKLALAADNRAWVYVNGQCIGYVAHWSQVFVLPLTLRHADVIAIKAQGSQAHYGVIADLLFQTMHLITGGPHWKALRGSPSEKYNPSGWKTAAYNSCHWRAPVIRTPPSTALPRQARTFSNGGGAHYVWAANAAAGDTILLRSVIGGEKCDQVCVPSKTSITLEADTSAWLYVNGRYIGAVAHGREVWQAQERLKKGDVIGITARDTGNVSGVKVEINAGTDRKSVV